MDKVSLWTKLTAKMKSNKKVEIGVYVGIGLLVVLLYLSGIKPTATKEAPAQTVSPVLTARDDEERLKFALSQIRGAGRVEVMLTYENGKELVPAYSSDTQSTTNGESQSQSESTRPLTISRSGEEETMVLKEVEPRIRGVIVIAEGADDIKVRMDLMRAVSKVLDVEAERVEVFTMEQKQD